MYRIIYGASKMKITVVSSEIDAKHLHDVKPWAMDGQGVQVVVDNDHLGQVVSYHNKEKSIVDLKMEKGRNNLYSLLGSGFAFKSFLSQVLKLHIYSRVFQTTYSSLI